ncbi:hypoxanthine/guanine phosphoribosyltransferase [Halovenus marina]|jgi:adenine phosphoribosyltransferase|uniref:hypoxanthine/guanine phosphoribosyltransferase n=1 Tax=Halovenus marina TaxID=3396621 RepID=UPI003F553F8E
MDRLKQSLRETPVVEKEGYHYFVHPVSDGVPMLEPALLREIVVQIVKTAPVETTDKIVVPEAMGIHIGTGVSLATDIPLVIVRKRQYGLDGEVSLSQVTGYDENEMFINDIDEGDRVLVLDDVLSTGGTLSALLTALEDVGAEIADAIAVIGKVGGEDRLAGTAYEPKTLVDVDVVDGEVVIVDEGV